MKLINNMNDKIKTSLVIGMSMTVLLPLIHAVYGDAGTVENYYWQNNPGICYKTGDLNQMTVDGATSSGTSVETEFDKAVSMMNGAFSNSISISADSTANCNGSYKILVDADNLDDVGVLAQEYSNFSSTSMSKSHITFNTQGTWKTTGTSCTTTGTYIEYIANHELGHGVGLKHHEHNPINSMMNPSCNSSTFDDLQTVDQTALDIKYPAPST